MTAPAAELREALARLARVPRLLVAVDYDGTLAPIVTDPDAAFPRPESVAVLRELAELPDTTVAVISGRALADLGRLSGLGDDPAVHLVGSHGAELDAPGELPPEARHRLARLCDALGELVDGRDGVALEVKPASVAVHVRQAAPEVGREVLAAVRAGPASWPQVQVTEGKAVIELAVVRTDKGAALDMLRERAEADAVLFIGDDVTDERAFARLAGPDVGIKVGDGETAAGHRIPDTADVTRVLETLRDERSPRRS